MGSAVEVIGLEVGSRAGVEVAAGSCVSVGGENVSVGQAAVAVDA